MRILDLNQKENRFKVRAESVEDLWHLERLIHPGDMVSASTTRKIKGEEGQQTSREKFFLTLRVEKVDFQEFSGALRVHGVITSGKPEELVELGAAHALTVGPGTTIAVKKEQLRGFEIARLKKARDATGKKPVLLVVMDDEQADLAILRPFGIEKKGHLNAHKQGKALKSEDTSGAYFARLQKAVEEAKCDTLVLAGPGFWKEDFSEHLKEKGFSGHVHMENTNSVGRTGFNELLAGERLSRIVAGLFALEEARLMERILEEIGKNSGLAEYGQKEVGAAVQAGAVEHVLVLDTLLAKERENLLPLLEQAEQLKAEVHLISHKSDAGQKLEGLGGVAAVLRYRVSA